MQETAIVIPCYNEETRLQPREFLNYTRRNANIHFLFVNDCSTDATSLILDDLCLQNHRQCIALHLPHNLGKAGAVRAGFIEAFAGQYAAIGFWDADLATPLFEIDHFCALLTDAHHKMVLGARVRLLSRRIERQTIRHYLGRIFATLASVVLGLTIYDTQCGAKIFANTQELQQVFAKPFTVSWIFDVEILARYMLLTRYQGAAPLADIACEYPLREWLDVPGSKLKARDFGLAIFEMAKIWSVLHGVRSQQYYKELLDGSSSPLI
jgi:glycosyltransferase involved in cell wall biosynthesis